MTHDSQIPPRDYDGSRLWARRDFERDFNALLESVAAAESTQRDFICRLNQVLTLRRVAAPSSHIKTFNTGDHDFAVSKISEFADEMLKDDTRHIKIESPGGIFFLYKADVPGCDFELEDLFADDDEFDISLAEQDPDALLSIREMDNRVRYLQSLKTQNENIYYRNPGARKPAGKGQTLQEALIQASLLNAPRKPAPELFQYRSADIDWLKEISTFADTAAIDFATVRRPLLLKKIFETRSAIIGARFHRYMTNADPRCIILPGTAARYFEDITGIAFVPVPFDEWAARNPYGRDQQDYYDLENTVFIVGSARTQFVAIDAMPSETIKYIVRDIGDGLHFTASASAGPDLEL